MGRVLYIGRACQRVRKVYINAHKVQWLKFEKNQSFQIQTQLNSIPLEINVIIHQNLGGVDRGRNI